MSPVLNAAAYLFVEIDDAPMLRERLYAAALEAGLTGTVLLAQEGINLSLAGVADALRAWLLALRGDARFGELRVKESWSDRLPHRRLRVKVKREIIRMGRPEIRPADGRAPAVDSGTLARWIAQGRCDEGRPIVLLDTRNGFEVDAGAFDDAIDLRLSKFSEFPAALVAHRHRFDGKTVVSYCTGGIRCEKAALVMHEAGVAHVHQLDGGILKYFEDAAGAPGWHGACFVFDERVSLGRDLQPAAA